MHASDPSNADEPPRMYNLPTKAGSRADVCKIVDTSPSTPTPGPEVVHHEPIAARRWFIMNR